MVFVKLSMPMFLRVLFSSHSPAQCDVTETKGKGHFRYAAEVWTT